MKELTVKADTKNLLKVQSFINEQLEEYDCPMLTQTSIGIAVEELFVNICHYAYAPDAKKLQILSFPSGGVSGHKVRAENRITKQSIRKARLFG